MLPIYLRAVAAKVFAFLLPTAVVPLSEACNPQLLNWCYNMKALALFPLLFCPSHLTIQEEQRIFTSLELPSFPNKR